MSIFYITKIIDHHIYLKMKEMSCINPYSSFDFLYIQSFRVAASAIHDISVLHKYVQQESLMM